MTPSEKNIVKCLVALAWADGKVRAPESGVIEGLLCGFLLSAFFGISFGAADEGRISVGASDMYLDGE